MESLRIGRTFDEEMDYYKEEWHDYYPTIIRLVLPNSHVLDVGCARGDLSQYLRDKLNCRVTGLDVSDEAVKICKEKGIDAIRCNIEEENAPGKYDAIILCAILEHLMDPVSVLIKLKGNLEREGNIIVGVPNFSHIMARISYLLGKNIQYYDRTLRGMLLGVQPAGHVHFFNKVTLSYLLQRTGYEPVRWSYYKSRGMFGLYRLPPPHALFSSFIAVRAKCRTKHSEGIGEMALNRL